MIKIGVCVRFTSLDAIPEKFKKLKDCGFESCQLICWDRKLMTPENAGKIKEYVAEYGIEISAFWCGWSGPAEWNFYEGQNTLGLVPPDYRAKRIEELCIGSDFAKLIGVEDVVTHMGFIPENPNDPNFHTFCVAVKEVAKHCKNNGQYLLFETGQETPVTMLRCFEEVGTDNLGVNLDTANLILYGKANPVDALDVFGKYVRNLHAKDGKYPTNGRDLGRETKLGDGSVDFRRLFEKLKELGYDRYVTIEREIEGEEQTKDILWARDYLNGIIAELN